MARRTLTLRLAEDLARALAAEAARTGASVNSEIVRAIRAHIERTNPTPTERTDDHA